MISPRGTELKTGVSLDRDGRHRTGICRYHLAGVWGKDQKQVGHHGLLAAYALGLILADMSNRTL
jgi:hypothetical protein